MRVSSPALASAFIDGVCYRTAVVPTHDGHRLLYFAVVRDDWAGRANPGSATGQYNS